MKTLIISTAIIVSLIILIKKIVSVKFNIRTIKRKSSKRFFLESIFLCIILYGPILIRPYLSNKGIISDDNNFDSKIANFLATLIFMYNAFRYILDTIEQHNLAAIPYRPVYLVEKSHLDKKIIKKERAKKEVKITVNFAEGDAIIRNVNVYKLNDKDELEPLTSHSKLNNNDLVYEGSLKNDLLVAVDTVNRERVFTIITEHNIVNAIDQTYRLNFNINDLAYKTQDSMYESDKKFLINRLHKIIQNSIYYKKIR